MIPEGGEIFLFLLYVALGAVVVLGGLGMRVIFQRKGASPPSPEPYECGEKPIGSPYSPFLWPFLRIAAFLLVLEAEVILALPWVWVQKSLSTPLFWTELIFLTLPLVGLYLYVLRSGWLEFSPPKKRATLPPAYRQLNAYLTSQAPAP